MSDDTSKDKERLLQVKSKKETSDRLEKVLFFYSLFNMAAWFIAFSICLANSTQITNFLAKNKSFKFFFISMISISIFFHVVSVLHHYFKIKDIVKNTPKEKLITHKKEEISNYTLSILTNVIFFVSSVMLVISLLNYSVSTKTQDIINIVGSVLTIISSCFLLTTNVKNLKKTYEESKEEESIQSNGEDIKYNYLIKKNKIYTSLKTAIFSTLMIISIIDIVYINNILKLNLNIEHDNITTIVKLGFLSFTIVAVITMAVISNFQTKNRQDIDEMKNRQNDQYEIQNNILQDDKERPITKEESSSHDMLQGTMVTRIFTHYKGNNA